MVLIRSINKGQNNTLRQMTSTQYSTRGRIEIDVERQRKYLTAQRDKKNQISTARYFSVSLHLVNNPNPV